MNKIEYDIYIKEQSIRQERGFLTCSERKKLKDMIDNPKNYIIEKKEEKPYKKITTSYSDLKKSCLPITKEDDIKSIIEELKNTLNHYSGVGLSAEQIKIYKRISLIKIPIYNAKDKKIETKEYIIINPKIVEKSRKTIIDESCLSLPGLSVRTDRYVFVTVYYFDENEKAHTLLASDLEAITLQHEIDHQNGITIIDRKHRDINHRK